MSDFTKAELIGFRKALKKAIYAGATSVQYRDRRIQYDSVDAMERRLEKLNAEIDGEPTRRRIYPVYDSGL